MKSRSIVAASLMVALTTSVSYGQSATVRSNVAMLEKRVPDELAAEGIVLSRREATLKIEAVGESLLLSLVDDASGRVVASTKMDKVPSDREALVASVTHVVADLAAQGAPKAVPPQRAIASADSDLQSRKKQYRQQYLHFGEMAVVSGNKNGVTTSLSSIPFRGDMNEMLGNDEFYSIVGRQDLADRYRSRSKTGRILYLGGAVVLIAAPLVFLADTSTFTPMAVGLVGGAVMMGSGLYYAYTANGADANQAKRMARDYNETLLRQLRLEEQARNKRATRDVLVAAYAAPNGGGLVLNGRF